MVSKKSKTETTASKKKLSAKAALLRTAPHHTRRSRLDETRAARKPILRWQPEPSA